MTLQGSEVEFSLLTRVMNQCLQQESELALDKPMGVLLAALPDHFKECIELLLVLTERMGNDIK
jgi:hypothetical protein